jgi:hypothetical protein
VPELTASKALPAHWVGAEGVRDLSGLMGLLICSEAQVVQRSPMNFGTEGPATRLRSWLPRTCLRQDRRLGDAPPAPAGQKAVAAKFKAAFPDVRLEVEALEAEGDLVVARWTMTGPTGGARVISRRLEDSSIGHRAQTIYDSPQPRNGRTLAKCGDASAASDDP